MNYEQRETDMAYELVLAATDMVEYEHHAEDVDAAIIALLARAIEVASDRKLRSLDEIFQNTH